MTMKECQVNHENLWFSVILYVLETGVPVAGTWDLACIKEAILENQNIDEWPVNRCYLCAKYICEECPLTLNGNICLKFYNNIGMYNFEQQIVIFIYIATCFLELAGSSLHQCREYAFKRLYEIGIKNPAAISRLKELRQYLSEKGL